MYNFFLFRWWHQFNRQNTVAKEMMKATGAAVGMTMYKSLLPSLSSIVGGCDGGITLDEEGTIGDDDIMGDDNDVMVDNDDVVVDDNDIMAGDIVVDNDDVMADNDDILVDDKDETGDEEVFI